MLDEQTADPRQIIAELRRERDEALAREAAIAEVLQVINASPGNLKPVFDAMLERATRLCEADAGVFCTYSGGYFLPAVWRGFDDFPREPIQPHPETGIGRLARGEDIVHILDSAAGDAYRSGDPGRLAIVRLGGARTQVAAALRHEGNLLGSFTLWRREVRAFTDKEIALLENFAAQAVIAIESARLLNELRDRTCDLQESLEYQTAISDVLKVISRSTFDLQPVLDAVTETSVRLCAADSGHLAIRQGEGYRAVATCGVRAEHEPGLRSRVFLPGRDTVIRRSLLERRIVHVTDLAADPEYGVPSAINVGGTRTVIAVPLVREDEPIGVMVLSRRRVEPFTERQIELIRTFADQAVIAIENTRLITETREALEQQTATAEVLQVINSSPGDLQPVFDAMLEKAMRVCGVATGMLATYAEGRVRTVAIRGAPAAFTEFRKNNPPDYGPGTAPARILAGERVVHVLDLKDDDLYRNGDPNRRAIVDLGGARTALLVPLLKGDARLGHIGFWRQEVRPFSTKEIALLENFAAQAVIAMENARLLNELQDRTRDLQESLEYQTAISDVLKVISQSTFDLQPVLDILVVTAARLCVADQAVVFRRDADDAYALAANFGFPPAYEEFHRAHGPIPVALRPGSPAVTARAASERRVIHIDDVAAVPGYPEVSITLGKQRTTLGVPLLREGEPIGVRALARQRVEPFTERQIELVTTFADQAVIAIENARLLSEIRQRQAELRVTFDNMGDGVAMFDAGTRLVAWNRNFQQILDLPDDFVAARPSFAEYFDYLARRGEYDTKLEAELRRTLSDAEREVRFERTRPDGRVIEVRRNAVPGGGFVLIVGDITERKRAEAAIRAARDTAEQALSELKAAQASLLHAQKMSALGQLTAGIAHEIKNPLNFVNNFAGLSNELLDELKEMATPALAALDADTRADIDETIDMLSGNLDKIAEHGRRADNIVKSMLAHSRGSSGERQQIDLNALVDEALNLAYHGARAQDQNFNITMERDFDASLAPVELVPQDMMRVFINLIGNGFHAAHQRRTQGADPGFRPVLRVATRDLGDAVEVRVRDNGTGILPEHRDRLFQPFFTTKPTGEGTGLGLSISYDIVTQEHGGAITVDSEPGMFTEFTVHLPRAERSRPGRARTTERAV
jgi:two-component system NtrC family sensor kinase